MVLKLTKKTWGKFGIKTIEHYNKKKIQLNSGIK